MAEQVSDEPGARIPKDAIDPELIRLKRARPKVGLITAAGLVFLSFYFIVKLNPDRKFAGGPALPDRVALADVIANNVAVDRFIKLEGAEPLTSHAIRTTTAKGSLGLRTVPVRGTGERLWIAMSGDGWEPPALGGYTGRLRKLSDLPFAKSVTDYANEHPRPVFASARLVRAGFASSTVVGVAGDSIKLADTDRVAFDVLDANTAVVVGTLNERFPTPLAWATALSAAGIATTGEPHPTTDAVRYDVRGEVSSLAGKLEAANLWAARVEPVTHHYETTWAALRASPAGSFVVGSTTIADPQLDLVGLYVERSVPSDAYVVITGDRPEDYWYVLPITIALGVIGLVFAWALVRAVKRDLLPARA